MEMNSSIGVYPTPLKSSQSNNTLATTVSKRGHNLPFGKKSGFEIRKKSVKKLSKPDFEEPSRLA
jgi:hypothetical protein